ncbi:low temperature requirement protein A [Micromonospora musae]|uniref:Low temperature requirement protein A n=1 Tax=Micromonospora musae TaxID=1894970 RepID=A0A3A9Y537_9ACTN|nr:low temperature requirement protein A [Micromonospora musae]RKN32399.1 low temperature requirement protein A [Micromonospora musae]
MAHILGIRRPVPIGEAQRTTPFEIFFDLVFAFAFIRVATFMAGSPTPLGLAQGLVFLMLLWWPFTTFAWLANQVRADVGLVRAGLVVVMAAMFVAGLVIPYAWGHETWTVSEALTVAVAYIVIRTAFYLLNWHAAVVNRPIPAPGFRYAIPIVGGWIPLLLGAVLGGTTQTLLWAAAFLIDCLGTACVSLFSKDRFRVRSASHLCDRHGLLLIIALGESLIAVGAGAGSAVTRWPVLIAALLAVANATTLWWLYFENAAAPAGQALARLPDRDRVRPAINAYSLAHFPLIAGIIYLALGIELVLEHLAHHPSQHPAGAPLDWTSTAALFGGPVVYLIGRGLFLQFTVGHTSRAQIVAAAIMLALLPVGRSLPALGAFGVITAVLAALVCYERIMWQPTAGAR